MTTDTESDENLVAKTLDGDLKAFADLISKHKSATFAAAFSRVKDFDEAQDIAQGAFINAYANLGTLKDKSKFGSWLYRITVNLCNTKVRRNEIQMVENKHISESQGGILESMSQSPVQPDEEYERKELLGLIQEAMEKLGDKTREAVTLFYVNGYSYKEMASYLSVPVSTVKARLNLGRRRLKEEVAHMVEGILKRKGPDESFTENVLTEICLGFPEGSIATSWDKDKEGGFSVFASTKSKDPEKARLISLTIRVEDARATLDSYFFNAYSEEPTPQPGTYDFIRTIIEEFKIKPERVVFKSERENGYAEVTLRRGKSVRTLRTSLSMGILLSYRMKTPVWATPELIRQGTVSEGGLKPTFEESLDAVKGELLASMSRNNLINIAFENGLNMGSGSAEATWTDDGRVIINGEERATFDVEANANGLALMKRDIGHRGWGTRDDGSSYTALNKATGNGVTVEFSLDIRDA